ncbi:MAG: hypothetical protein HYS57_02770 [Parcubacteria group bacterium]|nr:hypothetical protein [Parcubacteria group bacterium]
MKPEGKSPQYPDIIKAETERRREILESCKIEIYNPEALPWDEIKEDILRMETDAFDAEAFDEETLREDFENPKNIVVLLRDTASNRVVGFTYAEPTTAVYPELFPERKSSEDTAYISDTVIHLKYRKIGLLPLLMHKLGSELLKRGYLFMERDSADDRTNLKEGEETYADKVKKKLPRQNYR